LLFVRDGVDEAVDGDRRARAVEVLGDRVDPLHTGGILAGQRHLDVLGREVAPLRLGGFARAARGNPRLQRSCLTAAR
jgi:hypothetical protein